MLPLIMSCCLLLLYEWMMANCRMHCEPKHTSELSTFEQFSCETRAVQPQVIQWYKSIAVRSCTYGRSFGFGMSMQEMTKLRCGHTQTNVQSAGTWGQLWQCRRMSGWKHRSFVCQVPEVAICALVPIKIRSSHYLCLILSCIQTFLVALTFML